MSIVTVSHLMPLLNPATDAELLRHFVDTRDETAFAEIVRRHGGLVRGVAQRLLVDTDMAHDVFQATFLLLAKKAKHGKWERTIGPWLYQVACRMAFKARARRAKQPIRFVTGVESSAPSFHPADSLVWAEVRNAIDDELSLLPAIYRDPLILCYLEGLSRDEAADALGCTLTVLKGRLERGRVALRRGLERRGLTLSVGLATLIPDSCVSAKASEELARLAADSVMGVPIPAALRQLILMGSSGTVLKAVTLGGVLAALLLGMAVAISESGHPPQTIDSNAKNLVHSKSEKATETEYEPLPVGAVARLGSTRFRHAGLRDFVILKDGKSVVTAGKDGVLRYWNLDTGQQIRTVSLMGYETVHRLATLSPDGKLFAAAEDWQLDIWDAGSGKQIKHFPGLEIRPSDFLCFSDNGDYLVIGDSRHNVSILAWRSDRIDRQLPLPKTENGSDSSFHGYFTPDSSRVIAGGGWEEKLCVFDVKQLKKLLELPCNATTSTVTPDGKTLIVNTTRPGMRDSDICLHDLTTGKERKRFTVPGFFLRLTVSPDSRTLACSHSDQSCLVDLATGKVRHTLTGYPSGVDFTPDGTTLVSIEVAAAHLRTWNTVTGEEKNPLPGDIGLSAALVVSPDGRVLASADGMSKAVTLWDLSNGRVIRELPLGEIEKRRVRDLAYSTDGKLLYAVQGMGFTQWWDPTTGERRGSFQLSRPAKNALWQDPNAFFTSNYQLSPDGRRVVSLERRYDGLKVPRERTTLGMWDTSSGKLIAEREYPAPENNRRCKWLGNAFIGLPVPEGLSIFTPVTGKVQISIPDVTPNGPVVASPDGRLFAALVSARTDAVATVSVRIFEALTGRPISTIPVSKADYLALGPDDRTLVYAESRTLHILDLATGRERGRLQSEMNATGLILTPDGLAAVTPLDDGTGLVWNLTAFPIESLADKATEREIAGWWKDLLSNDAGIAYAAVWKLSAAPPATVLSFLQENLKPAPRPNPDEVTVLVKDLGDDDFSTREKATNRLAELGPAVSPTLRDALVGSESPEVRKRAKELLDKFTVPLQTPEGVRRSRAIGVLERIGSAEARKLLTGLASGPSGYIETDAAASALERPSQSVKKQ